MALVLAIVGATATGKTAVAEALARELGAEIVCADSRQVYRDLDVGTGKPTKRERAGLPHRLFDALELHDAASAGWYARTASAACAEVHAADKLPILVGGSGLYLRAAYEGLSQAPPRDEAIRARLREAQRALGTPAMHERLAVLDAETAARLAPGDTQRVLRALEVAEASGRPLSWWHRQPPTIRVEGEWRVVELTAEPETLERRIETRTREMFDRGLLDEVRLVRESGREAELRALRAVGYDEALELAAGTIDRAEAEARTNLRTRQLAKRQRTWFRNQIDAHRLATDDGRLGLLVRAVRRVFGV